MSELGWKDSKIKYIYCLKKVMILSFLMINTGLIKMLKYFEKLISLYIKNKRINILEQMLQT